MSFPSITNNQEFFSDYYLESIIANDLRGLRADWDAREQGEEHTPRRGVRGLRALFNNLKLDAEGADLDGSVEPLQLLHDAVLTSLGFNPARETITTARGEVVPVTLPVAHATTLPTGLRLIALEAVYATSPDEALGADSRLVEPLVLDGNEITEPTKAISLAFTVDDPPRHVLLLAGATVVLCARDSWPEGRFLAVDLDLALGRNDTKANGELDTVAALFSRDALVPGETGEAVIDELGTSSLKQAVGVSADLREGVRRSVEDVANEIVTQRLAKNLRVYNEPDVARRLTRESLRFLYRILFLLYAEARPELGIVPSLGEGYRDGYGLDRLRELALTELTTEHAKNGTHLHDSLDILFELVNDGYHHEFAQQQFTEPGDAIDDTGLIFEPLHSELFGPDATPLLDSIRLRNEVVQRVLARLLLTQERGGRERRFVSYATLGINQLGAVYEGLMAYTGFLADEDLHEVRKPGSEEKHGTWVVPVAKADEYEDEVFVTDVGDDGVPRRVTHTKGSFVYRLSGRDRQRSASYYTPEVLTRCVVKHALEELLDQDGNTTSADALLDLTLCEPALGSGAFLNEAINQLSAEYLARKQAELEDTIDPDKYAGELQKVKTHFALHQSYGVDLNATAVELAEVSLWLNAMHPGLRAPWFGLHLRRGNSLIGARRAVYSSAQLVGKKWLKTIPGDRGLSTGELQTDDVHHFLLPADGWGAVKGAKEARELRPKAVEALKNWHRVVTAAPSKADAVRYAALARRVEALWELAAARLALAERELRRPLGLYPRTAREGEGGLTTRAALEAALGDANTPLARLRLVMDAWCALWFWPLEPQHEAVPPTSSEWLATLEGLLGIDPTDRPDNEPTQIDLFADLEALEAREAELAAGLLMPSVEEVRSQHPWLEVVREIVSREGFFHWELEFAHVFRRGGFDLQVGNPPWVRLSWDPASVVAETDGAFAVVEKPDLSPDELSDAASSALSMELASHEATVAFLANDGRYEVVKSGTSNLYLNFMATTLTHRNSTGVVGLLHPETHMTDPGAGPIRRNVYPRLRRRWQFNNELKLFEDVGNVTSFAIHVYGGLRPSPAFLSCAGLLHPATLDDSMDHDGSGGVPGMKTPDGTKWDLSPHRDRVMTIESEDLAAWAALFDDDECPALEARIVRPHTRQDAEVITRLSRTTRRLAATSVKAVPGLDETGGVRCGDLVRRTGDEASPENRILEGPHFTVANPYFQNSREGRNHRDYAPVDLETLPANPVVRTNYAWKSPAARAKAESSAAESTSLSWRTVYRRRTNPGLERTIQAAVVPSRVAAVQTCWFLVSESLESLLIATAMWCSLPVDYVAKVLGKGDIRWDVARALPLGHYEPFQDALVGRLLRLNCLSLEFADLWRDAFVPAFQRDSWSDSDPRLPPWDSLGPQWASTYPLRTHFERRRALVEIDALAGLALGLTADQLSAIYRSTFGVLRKYEHAMRHDQQGKLVPREVWRMYEDYPKETELDGYVPPFTRPDREGEMRRAHAVFAERYADGVA